MIVYSDHHFLMDTLSVLSKNDFHKNGRSFHPVVIGIGPHGEVR